jgi:hypothetical protein
MASKTAPIDSLRHVVAVLARQNDPDSHFVAEGILAYLSGAVASLDEALGVKPEPGQRKPITLAMIAARNESLRETAAREFPGIAVSRQAHKMHTEMSRYAASAWKQDRHEKQIPERLAGTAQAVAWQMLTDEDRLISERQIRKILSPSHGY